jgi:23S rRNA (guanosine2251-2'-O)-methyltransferase
MMFCTILHLLKSPQNVGTIVRTHVAFGGAELVFVAHTRPWAFRKGSQAFSRRLEGLCDLRFLSDERELGAWCAERGYSTVAFEISATSVTLDSFVFPRKTALTAACARSCPAQSI